MKRTAVTGNDVEEEHRDQQRAAVRRREEADRGERDRDGRHDEQLERRKGNVTTTTARARGPAVVVPRCVAVVCVHTREGGWRASSGA